MGIPELEKAGKSVQLRRASEWMAELGERVGGFEKEVGELRGEKLDLEVCRFSSRLVAIYPLVRTSTPSML
jgi:hypothetical protein